MNPAARYAVRCQRYFLGLTKQNIEPLGAEYGLSMAEAEAIASATHGALVEAGITTKARWTPSSPAQEQRLIKAYHRRGLAA